MRSALAVATRQAGIILPLTAIMLVGLLAMAGLALDTGEVYEDYRRAQTAADAAALAGAFERFYGRTGSIQSAAQAAAADNGFTHGVDGIDVVVNHPPATAGNPYLNDDFSVEVVISQPSPTFFLGVLGIDAIDYKTTATANGDLAPNPNCVYVLDLNEEKAFLVHSSSVLDANCGIQVNSDDSFASNVDSGACVKATSVSVTGDFKKGQECKVSGYGPDAYDCGPGVDCPTPDSPAAPDPLMAWDDPVVDRSTSCPPQKTCNDYGCSGEADNEVFKPYHIDGTKVNGVEWPGPFPIVLEPKTYCGGIKLNGGADVRFVSGRFTLRGGGLNIEGNDTTACVSTQSNPSECIPQGDPLTSYPGAGVTFVNTCFFDCNDPNPEHAADKGPQWFAPLDINSSAGAPNPVDFRAALCDTTINTVTNKCAPVDQTPGSTEAIEGFWFWVDRTAPETSVPGDWPTNRIDSSVNAILTGGIYAAKQHLKYHSSAFAVPPNANRTDAVLISKFLEVSSNSQVKLTNFSGENSGGAPLRYVELVY